jgi:hypothetical protein
MHADNILQQNRVTARITPVPIKVLDVAQAVASQGELVGGNTETHVTSIECLLTVVGLSGV